MRSELTSAVAAADPARDLRLQVSDGVWQQMAYDIMTSEAGPATTDVGEPLVADRRIAPGQSTRATPRRVGRVLAALAAACALIAAPVGLSLTGRPTGASVAAAGVLDMAAIHATDPTATADQYWKITTTEGSAATRYETRDGSEVSSTWWVSDRTIAYVAVDGARPTYTEWATGVSQRQLSGGPGWSPRPRADSVETTNLTPNDLPGGWQTPNPAFLAGLPRDIELLRERLYDDAEGHGPSVDGEVIVLVADVLRSGIVPSDLRSALFEVLKTVPDVDITSRVVTLHGQPGVGIARTEPVNGTRQEIIVDPGTGLLIGERTVAVEPTSGVAVGMVITETSVRSTLVNEIPAATKRAAHHATCTVDADNMVTCSKAGSQPAR
ncbi:MAG TPA: CU044_5270 family protein [Humibacillus xanthopallidus]|nr:CU044_5270 family protein [Humibacillus xanthopallidus]